MKGIKTAASVPPIDRASSDEFSLRSTQPRAALRASAGPVHVHAVNKDSVSTANQRHEAVTNNARAYLSLNQVAGIGDVLIGKRPKLVEKGFVVLGKKKLKHHRICSHQRPCVNGIGAALAAWQNTIGPKFAEHRVEEDFFDIWQEKEVWR